MRSSCTNRCFLFQLFFQNNFSFLQRDCIIRKIVFHPIFEVWGGILNLACSMTRLDIDRTWKKKLYNLTRKDSELETRGKIFRNRTYNCCTHRIYRGIGGGRVISWFRISRFFWVHDVDMRISCFRRLFDLFTWMINAMTQLYSRIIDDGEDIVAFDRS